MKKILLSSALASTLLIASESKYEIAPMIGYVDTKQHVDLENHGVAGISILRNMDEDFKLDQLELGLLQSGSVDYENSVADTKITQIFLNGIKQYKLNDSFKLYALAGLGYERISNEEFHNESDPLFNYGVGAAYKFANDLSLKLDARHQLKFDGDKNILYTVGLAIPFGPSTTKTVETESVIESEPLESDSLMASMPAEEEVVSSEAVMLDSDNDGVVDSLDKCPTTDAGVTVDANGCEVLDVPADLGIVFATDSAKIQTNDVRKFEKYANYLEKMPVSKILLEAHTDSIGNAQYNLELSHKRANSVKELLVSMGVDENRITTRGYGETKPLVSNDTAANRAQNRRVTAQIQE